MADEYLKKEELEHGQAYAVIGRNFYVALWNEKRGVFHGIRHKFGDVFVDDEYYWDDTDDDGNEYGTVKPLRKLV